MDALDILTNLDRVIPYFQPIFSADEQRVIGYEVLGRFIEDTEAVSLGSFFRDEQIPEEYKVEVDTLLLGKAISIIMASDSDSKLFINRSAEQLMYENGEPFLEQLLSFEKNGFALDRLVLEISDGHYNGDYHQLVHLLTYYRTYGIQVAVAKKDFDNSTMDLIGLLEPNILKINLSSMRSSATSIAFQDIMFTLSILARKIGAALLFENIEINYQLQFAWSNGGRYYQGYYLGKPSVAPIDEYSLKDRLKQEFHLFISLEKKKLQAIYTTEETLHLKLQSLIAKNKKTGYGDLFVLLLKELEKIAFRMYICDEDGFQLSANFSKIPVIGWITQEEYIQKNWSWRPYFLENIIEMTKEKRGILSDLYSDIETGEQIRTFSFPISETEFLFIDISSHYLYESGGAV